MNSCKIVDVSVLREADHICIRDRSRWPLSYAHHGIVLKAGNATENILIAHLWSPLEGYRRAQADSKMRTTTLLEFLNNRPLQHLRRVQYHTSLIGNMIAKLGEVHRSKSDIPPVVIARCEFLMGLGQGKFNIVFLNCEHVAHWCMTGELWCKQVLTWRGRKYPFQDEIEPDKLHAFEEKVREIKSQNDRKYAEIESLHGQRVYLRVGADAFVRSFSTSRQLYAIAAPHEDDVKELATAFEISVSKKGYNYLKLSFKETESGKYICCKGFGIQLQTKRFYHRSEKFQFEYTYHQELQSQRNTRKIVGVTVREGILKPFQQKHKAIPFYLIKCE